MTDDKGISLEEFHALPEDGSGGISVEEFENQPDSYAADAKKMAAAFATGVGKAVPFGQDIPAAIGAGLSELGVGPKYVPEEGTFEERFKAAKKGQQRAYEQMGEEAPISRGVGMATGVVGSLPMFEVAAPAEAAFASKAIPAFEGLVGKGAGTEAVVDAASQGLKGAWQSAVSGLGEGDTLEERIKNAKEAGTWGAGVGALLPQAGKFLGFNKLSEAEQAAERLGAPLPASVGSENIVSRPLSEALGISPLTKGIMESGVAKGIENLEEAMIKKGKFKEGLTKDVVGAETKDALTDWLTGDLTGGYRDLNKQKWDKVQSALGPRANIIRTPMTNTKAYLDKLLPQQKRLGYSTAAFEPYASHASDTKGLIYKDLRELKTQLGEQLDAQYFEKGKKDARLEGLYHEIEKDIKNATLKIGGPDAEQMYESAVRFSRNMHERRKALMPILGPGLKRSNEEVYNKILNAAENNADLVKRARTIITRSEPKAWEDLTSRAAEQLGRTPKDPTWSPGRFAGNYNKLSSTGKDVLFGPAGSARRKAMEDVAVAAKRYVDAGKDKHYSKLTLALVTGAAADAAAAAGLVSAGSLPAIAATGLASYPAAYLLSKPRLAHAFARYLENPQNENLANRFKDMARLYVTKQTAPVEEQREERASGGKVGKRDYPAKRLNKLERAAKRAQDQIALETKPIMDQPDALVAKALEIAKGL